MRRGRRRSRAFVKRMIALMQGFNLAVNWTGLIFKKPNQSIGRHKKLNTIKVFLGDGSENSTTANHVFFKEMILELVEKKTLMFSFRVNCRETIGL